MELKPRKSFIHFDEAAYISKDALKIIEDYKKYTWKIGADYSFVQDYQCEWKPKKEKKRMGKITEDQLNDTLEAFAEALGLEWHRFSQRLSGRIEEDKLPKVCDEQTTKEVITKSDRSVWDYYLGGSGTTRREATVLGKVNAIAKHLGVDFDVQPERVVAEKVVIKTTKKVTAKKVVKKAKKVSKK